MRTAKRISAAVMAAFLLAASTVFCGCGSGGIKEGKNGKISKDEKWYSANRATVGGQYAGQSDVQSCISKYVGSSDELACFHLEIQKSVPQGQDPMTADYDALQLSVLEFYGKDGSLVDTVDLKKGIADSGMFRLDPGEYSELIKMLRKDADKDKSDEEVFKENDISVSWMANDDFMIKDSMVSFSAQVVFPAKDGSSWEQKTINIGYDFKAKEYRNLGEARNNSQAFVQAVREFEDYKVILCQPAASNTYTIKVTLPDGKEAEYKLDSALPNSGIDYIDGLIYLGDGKMLFEGENYSSGNITQFYEFDLNTGKCKEYLDDVAWCKKDLFYVNYVSGVGNVVIDQEGIKVLDLEKKCKTEYFSFSSCNINRSDTYNMTVLDIKDDHIYLSALSMTNADLFDTNENITHFYALSLEKENPHAGKNILRVTTLGVFSYSFCEAVCRFNDTNRNYFIKIDEDYSITSKINSGEISYWDEDYDAKADKASSELSYQLAVDLMNGDGPDMVFGGYRYSNLNNSKYLLDLKNEIKTSGVFDNVLKACETDGKLFQCPLSFSLSGIVVPSSLAGDKQYGFTYDQYKDLVKGPCNGADPISVYRDQTDYLKTCMNTMPDVYLKDGKADFDNKEFRELAEYVKDNAPAKRIESETDPFVPVEKDNRGCRYDVGITLTHMLRFYGDSLKDTRLMGFPSGDGRGPVVSVDTSIGISAQTDMKNACIEFVRYMLSEDVQKLTAEYDSATPVNINAYKKGGIKAVEKYNDNYKRNSSQYNRQELREFGFAWCEVDKSAVDEYEKAVRSCTCAVYEDPTISIIVKEEMPAYLTGQKSLDEVIRIINDRAKTVVSERG